MKLSKWKINKENIISKKFNNLKVKIKIPEGIHTKYEIFLYKEKKLVSSIFVDNLADAFKAADDILNKAKAI